MNHLPLSLVALVLAAMLATTTTSCKKSSPPTLFLVEEVEPHTTRDNVGGDIRGTLPGLFDLEYHYSWTCWVCDSPNTFDTVIYWTDSFHIAPGNQVAIGGYPGHGGPFNVTRIGNIERCDNIVGFVNADSLYMYDYEELCNWGAQASDWGEWVTGSRQ